MKTDRIFIAKLKEDLRSEEWISAVEVYQPLVESWAKRFGAATSEIADISQDVMFILVRELPKFVHNGRTGAFRTWLKTITINRLRQTWKQQSRQQKINPELNDEALNSLSDPHSELSQRWDREHDQHVLRRMLDSVAREFDDKALLVFERYVIQREDARSVAKELAVSTAQIYKYKFRVMNRLKELSELMSEPGLDTVFCGVVDKCQTADRANDLRKSA